MLPTLLNSYYCFTKVVRVWGCFLLLFFVVLVVFVVFLVLLFCRFGCCWFFLWSCFVLECCFVAVPKTKRDEKENMNKMNKINAICK